MIVTDRTKHAITQRAHKFLATLERRAHIPTKEVELSIQTDGFPCFSSWLDFHEDFAGYVEHLGRDDAVWGLIHEKPTWLVPYKADIDREPNEETWYITCTDIHPSYSYRLDNKGEFLTPPATSFAVHVERIALGWAFGSGHKTRRLTQTELRDPALIDDVLPNLQSVIIPEASDRYFTYYMSEKYFLVQNLQKGNLRSGSIALD